MRYLIVVICLLVTSTCFAESGLFFIGPHGGRGRLKIKNKYSVEKGNVSVDNTEIGVAGGYKFGFNGLVEIGSFNNFSFSMFGAVDSYELSQKQVLLGYSFDIVGRFRIIPKVGASFWKLETKEGQFLNSGPEEEKEFKGIDMIWLIDLEIPIK